MVSSGVSSPDQSVPVTMVPMPLRLNTRSMGMRVAG